MRGKKDRFRKKIIRHLYIHKALSLADISLSIEKSLPVTTELINSLLEDGHIIDMGYAQSTGGRKPVMYALNSDILYVISIAMDQFVTRIAVMNMKNEFVIPVQKFELPLLNNQKALATLVEKIEEVIAISGIPKSKFAGIGIGMPGFVDIERGLNYTYLRTEDTNIVEYMTGRIKIPVFLDNDSSTIALAELHFGGARDAGNVMVVNVGWGLGLGIILGGKLYRGSNGFAGEFSHIPLLLNDKLCACGKKGCLETEASLLVLVEKAVEGINAGKTTKLKDLSEMSLEEASLKTMKAAHEGDQFAIGLLSEIGHKIGRGVAILIHVFNPEVVLISGRGSAVGKIIKAPIQQAINEYCIPSLAEHTTIEISAMGYEAELIGSAALVMENYENELTTHKEKVVLASH